MLKIKDLVLASYIHPWAAQDGYRGIVLKTCPYQLTYLFTKTHTVHPLCMVSLAQSSEGWIWYVKQVLCPGIRGLEQESFITHTDDL